MNTNHSIRSRGICLLDCYLQNVFVCVFVMREWYFCFLCFFWKCGGWWCRWCVGMIEGSAGGSYCGCGCCCCGMKTWSPTMCMTFCMPCCCACCCCCCCCPVPPPPPPSCLMYAWPPPANVAAVKCCWCCCCCSCCCCCCGSTFWARMAGAPAACGTFDITLVGVVPDDCPPADPAPPGPSLPTVLSPSAVVFSSKLESRVVSLPDLLFFSFFTPGLAKCRSSRWRRKFRDWRMTA